MERGRNPFFPPIYCMYPCGKEPIERMLTGQRGDWLNMLPSFSSFHASLISTSKAPKYFLVLLLFIFFFHCYEMFALVDQWFKLHHRRKKICSPLAAMKVQWWAVAMLFFFSYNLLFHNKSIFFNRSLFPAAVKWLPSHLGSDIITSNTAATAATELIIYGNCHFLRF